MSEDTQSRADGGRPAIEWVFGSVSAALVAALLLYLGYQAVFTDARPPELLVSIERFERLDTGTVVTVAVANRGEEAASGVTVYAAASDSSGTAARKQIEFDYIAAHAVRRGAFIFTGPISPDDVKLEVGGYAEP